MIATMDTTWTTVAASHTSMTPASTGSLTRYNGGGWADGQRLMVTVFDAGTAAPVQANDRGLTENSLGLVGKDVEGSPPLRTSMPVDLHDPRVDRACLDRYTGLNVEYELNPVPQALLI